VAASAVIVETTTRLVIDLRRLGQKANKRQSPQNYVKPVIPAKAELPKIAGNLKTGQMLATPDLSHIPKETFLQVYEPAGSPFIGKLKL
jgi:hypothetical protein